jgi:hypothetical protein
MKIIVGLFLLVNTSYALAGIAGDWQGWGTWTYDGSGTHCDMTMRFEETKTTFSRKSGYFDCLVVGLEVEPVTYTKKGDQLYDGEKLVGVLTDNSLELSEVYSETVNINTTIKIDGHHFDYKEIWLGHDGSQIYNIDGRMFLKNSL